PTTIQFQALRRTSLAAVSNRLGSRGLSGGCETGVPAGGADMAGWEGTDPGDAVGSAAAGTAGARSGKGGGSRPPTVCPGRPGLPKGDNLCSQLRKQPPDADLLAPQRFDQIGKPLLTLLKAQHDDERGGCQSGDDQICTGEDLAHGIGPP